MYIDKHVFVSKLWCDISEHLHKRATLLCLAAETRFSIVPTKTKMR